ncbi:MAG: DUF4147 domain-containing protein [Candidatus Riflebacteria bacterium]|nr:DUF4147 domain-containing protein [Candidatus Riflebacteria bacterium]
MLINNLRELNEGYDSRDSAFINVALSAYEEAIKACDPYKTSLSQFTLNGSILTFKNKNYNLDYYNNIYVIGAGKAGYKMGKAINELLGDRITEGCICVPQDSDIPEEMLGKIRFMECAHPIPDMDSILSARIITRIADKAEANDLIIFLLSGGASSLMCLPAEGITLAEKQNVNNLLLKCGADIKEINTVRKHLSAIKGGKLAEIAYPAETIQLIISDVLDNSLETIGSGPAIQDKTTLADAVSILKKHSIWESIPENVADFLTTNTFSKNKKFTDEEKGKIFEKVSTSIIADNHIALNAIAKFLEDYDFKLFYYPRAITGEASEEAKEFFFYVSKLKKDILDPFAVISGGEPVVTFKRNTAANVKTEDTDGLENVPRNSFKSNFKSENIASLGEELRNKQLKSIVAGGRAQEFALAMLKYFVEFPDRQIFFLAAGTDGIDGPTDAAGAIISGKTVEKAKKKNCSFEESLSRHDSYNFFKNIGGLIKTGYTGTNVNDIFIALVPPQID